MERNELYKFAEFRLDIRERALERTDGSENIPLPDKAFQTLCVLVQNSGRLMTKRELLEAVWPDSFVEENNLDKSIHAIRSALNEKASGQKYIETVRKHGYRFVAPVKVIGNENGDHLRINERTGVEEGAEDSSGMEIRAGAEVAAEARSSQLPESGSANSGARPLKHRTTLVGSALVVAALAATALGYYFFGKSPGSSAGKRSVAVLPFKPVDPASRNEIYELGMAHTLINQLTAVEGLIIRPYLATRKYADLEQDPITAGKEQQTDFVIASSYQLADGKIRVTAHVYDVASGEVVDVYEAEKDVAGVFATQDTVTAVLANQLLVRFSLNRSDRPAKRGTAHEEAYRMYLQGMYLYGNRSQGGLPLALESFSLAVSLDPSYALAWAAKAHAHRMVGNTSGRKTNLEVAYHESMDSINKALELDPNLSEAHSALCENKFIYEWDFPAAEAACKRAIELDPNSSLSHQIYARFLMGRGRPDEAIAEIKTAIDIEPSSVFNQRLLGNCLWNARRFEEAAAQFRRVMAMEEQFPSNNMWLSATLAALGREDEAAEVFINGQRKQKDNEEAVSAYRKAYESAGWKGLLIERANRWEAGTEVYFQGSTYFALLGNKDKAFELLGKALERRDWSMHLLKVDPRLDSLRDDPRYADLVYRFEN